MRYKIRRVKTGIDIALLLFILLFFCGCQPTPTKTATVYGGGLDAKIEGTPAPIGAYDAPTNWQETLHMKGNDTKVEIDALIRVPEVTAFPIYKVKQIEFDEARILSLVNYFAKGRDIMKDTEPTKADWEKQLILAKKNNDEEMIAAIESSIAAAPETVQAEVITDWSVDESPSGSFLAEDGEYAQINVSSNSFGYMKKEFLLLDSLVSLSDKDLIEKATISEEDAITAAQNMLDELGIDYMIAGSLERAQCYPSIESVLVEPVEEPLSKGYLIKFVRNINGIAGITDHAMMFGVTDDYAYRAPLYPEEMRVYVDEAGEVQSFDWLHPLKVEELITENAELLPFEDVKQRIRDMLTFINFDDSLPVQVTSIELNMAIVDIKDHLDEAMYVPAWFIYYTETFNDPDTGEKEQQEFRLGLNAIDGGRVLEYPVSFSPDMQQAIDEHLN